MSNHQLFAVDTGGLTLPETYTEQLLAVSMQAETYADTWHKAGYLQAVVKINGVDFTGKWFPLVYGYQLIEVPYAKYRLRYRPVNWRKNHLQIKQLSKSQSKQIMPLYNIGATIAEQPVLDSLPTSFVAQPYNTATASSAYLALPSNPARQTYAIVNVGTAIAHLDLDPPTSNTKRLITIPAGGTYVSDIPYVGGVYVWSSTTATIAIEVREFIQ
jgi:hypothetical protein